MRGILFFSSVSSEPLNSVVTPEVYKHFNHILKDKTIRAGSILGGNTGQNASTSPERTEQPDPSTPPVNEGTRKPVPKNDLSNAAMESKFINCF